MRAERTENSTVREPAPARDETVVSPFGTPLLRFTVPYGMPEEKEKERKDDRRAEPSRGTITEKLASFPAS